MTFKVTNFASRSNIKHASLLPKTVYIFVSGMANTFCDTILNFFNWACKLMCSREKKNLNRAALCKFSVLYIWKWFQRIQIIIYWLNSWETILEKQLRYILTVGILLLWIKHKKRMLTSERNSKYNSQRHRLVLKQS